ncbi:MAG TPA: hypothetical protein VFA65_24390 [Bryobacteraceae bacterium]|nr:hypothetical protein [Bryobacteraceae bacterium]
MMQIVSWFFLGVSLMLFAWGFHQVRYGTTPLDAYLGLAKAAIGLVLFVALLIAFAIGAMAAPRDGFISVMEAAFGMSPGGTRVVPQCPCSIEYLGAKALGRGVYAVYIKKLD